MSGEVSGELVPLQRPNEIALLGQVQQMLVEAKNLPDFRRVMEAAGAAADTARRYARLLEAQKMATETVETTNKVANELSAVHIEAQAGAGRVLKQMRESGQRAERGGWKERRRGENEEVNSTKASKPTLQDIVGTRTRQAAHTQASRWEKIDDIPSEVRSTYVRRTQDEGGEVTTAGLLRFAREPSEPKESTRTDVEIAYDEVVALLGKLIRYNPEIISGHATNTQRRTKFRKLLSDAGEWVDNAQGVFGN